MISFILYLLLHLIDIYNYKQIKMSISKKYLKKEPKSKVRFSLSKDAANGAKKVQLVGEFNKWDKNATPMKKQKTGEFATTIDLETGKEYQFRYVINDEKWINDQEADKFVPNGTGDDNSVVVV